MWGDTPLSTAGTGASTGKTELDSVSERHQVFNKPGSPPTVSPAVQPFTGRSGRAQPPAVPWTHHAVCSLTYQLDSSAPLGLAQHPGPPSPTHFPPPQRSPQQDSGVVYFQHAALCQARTGQPLWSLEGSRSPGFT